MTNVHHGGGARGRRSPRTSGDAREQAILDTATTLLDDRPIGQISVDDLAGGAGISRSSFYFYFPSKDAVVLTLLDRLTEEAKSARDAMLERTADDPGAALRQSIELFVNAYSARRRVIRAAIDLSVSNAEAAAVWSRILEDLVTHVTGRIELVRNAGRGKPGPSARNLAIALVELSERVMRGIFLDETPAIPLDEAVDTLTHIWASAILE